MTVRKYSYLDADAPILTSDAPGAMANLLRKVLVDGYGSGAQAKEPAGWEMDWDSDTNQRAAFRSTEPASSRYWLYVDDRNGADTGFAGGNRWARAWGMETFDGWDQAGDPIASGRFPLENQSAWGVTLYKNSGDNSSTSVPWEIVADARGFWLLVDGYRKNDFAGTNAGAGGALHYIGDYIARGQAVANTFAVCGFESENFTSNDLYTWAGLNKYDKSNRPGCWRNTNSDGSKFSVGFGHARLDLGDADYPDPIAGALLASQPVMTENRTSQCGQLPGILAAGHRHGADEANFPHGLEITIDGRLHRNWRYENRDGGGFIGSLWIDVEGPWHGA